MTGANEQGYRPSKSNKGRAGAPRKDYVDFRASPVDDRSVDALNRTSSDYGLRESTFEDVAVGSYLRTCASEGKEPDPSVIELLLSDDDFD
jgi:hypothetical protein